MASGKARKKIISIEYKRRKEDKERVTEKK